jgi:hypothetical protein
MFDEHNPTVEDEIVSQKLESVLVRPMAFADKNVLAEMTFEPCHI